MKKYSKVATYFLLVILAVLLLSMPVIRAVKSFSSYEYVMKNNWGIDIPAKAGLHEIYSKDTGASFHGDGTRYHVFSYQEDNEILNLFDWNTNNRQTRYYKSIEETLKNWIEGIGISDSDQPDFDSCVYWYETQHDDEIIILWDKNKKLLYVVEFFM